MSEHHFTLTSGTTLKDRYVIEKPLSSGGFSITYIAWDKTLEMKTVVKEYMPKSYFERKQGTTDVILKYDEYQLASAEGISRFLKEARILARFTHNFGIAGVIDYFSENNTAYIVMPYCEGETLTVYVKNSGGTLEYKKCLALLLPVMKALAEVHGEGVLHRDISPDNILITDSGRAVLLDFGLSESVAATEGLAIQKIPTAVKHGYAPPEQYCVGGIQGPWTDIYALAATMYHCLTGVTPLSAVERMHRDDIQHLRRLNRKVPRRAAEAIMKALSLSSKGRLAKIDEFMRALTSHKPHVKQSVISKTAAAALILAAGLLGGYMAAQNAVPTEPAHAQAIEPADSPQVPAPQSTISQYVEADSSHDVSSPEQPSAQTTTVKLELSDNDAVPFSDSKLEAAVRDAIGKPEGAILFREVSDVRSLDISGKGIESLDGIQYFEQLANLTAFGNMVSDVSPVTHLEHLERLSLAGNLIEDVSPLMSCIRLSELDLHSNYLSDISVIGCLTNLNWLDLYGNNITDISPLARLPKLNWINISSNQITDISPLAKCPKIEEIAADSNGITDVGAFEGHPTLQKLQYS